MTWEIRQGDALEHLRKLGSDCFDAVITDPPYNVGKDYGEGPEGDRREDYESWLAQVLGECRRVSRDGVIFTPGATNVELALRAVRAGGLTPHRWLGWHKREFAGDLWNGGPAMCWEPVLWSSKAEKPRFNKRFGTVGRDFLVVNETKNDPFKGPDAHPNPKPLPVMHWLVGLFVPEGGSVLDPFAGSGAALRAAEDLGHDSLGIELNPAYCDLTCERMAQGVLTEAAAK